MKYGLGHTILTRMDSDPQHWCITLTCSLFTWQDVESSEQAGPAGLPRPLYPPPVLHPPLLPLTRPLRWTGRQIIHTHSLQLKDFALCIDWLLVVKFWLYSILIDPLQQYRYSFNFMCKYFLCQSQEILNKISELELKLKHSNALNDQRKADLQEISDKFRKAATTQQILLLARHFSLIEKLCLRVLTRVPNSVA